MTEKRTKIELHRCDNMELMARYPDKHFELAIVDPPYQNNDAIGLKDNIGVNKQAAKRNKYRQFKNIAPTYQYFETLKKISVNNIVWGGNYFGLKGGVIAWNKHGTAFGEGEIAICTTHNSVRFFEYTWNGMLQQNMKNKQIRIHQTEKPIDLYKWILDKYAKQGDKILDTHGGSMSIAIACIDYGFDLVLCELDEEYFEKGVERVLNHARQLDLFQPQPEILVYR